MTTVQPKLTKIVAAALCVLSVHAAAQPLPQVNGFPNTTIKFVSPFPPGGGNDATARFVTTKLQAITGQSAIVDNRPGAGGNIGTRLVATGPADGYTVLSSQVSIMAVNPTLYGNVGFDPVKSFVPITQVSAAPIVIVVAASSPLHTFADLAAAAKAKPGEITFGTPGNGTLSHLVGMNLDKDHGVKLTHIPYKGAGPAITDLLGGHVSVLISSTSSVAGSIATGKMRALAVTSPRRIGVFSKVPTLEELGYKNTTYEDWYGFFAPAGTPPERVKYLHEAITRVLRSPDVSKAIVDGGSEVIANKPEEFAAVLNQDIAKWTRQSRRRASGLIPPRRC
jgi:tripartite-type tricarboxylate transporter receptor subunit TctC